VLRIIANSLQDEELQFDRDEILRVVPSSWDIFVVTSIDVSAKCKLSSVSSEESSFLWLSDRFDMASLQKFYAEQVGPKVQRFGWTSQNIYSLFANKNIKD
jgi:hypothetical protein